MGTRSTIAILREDGSVAKIYCHWDGYLEHNGRMLFEYYNTAEKVEELIALGDLSSLGREIGVKHPFGPDYSVPGDSFKWEQLYGGMCTAYGRDRGEKGTEARGWTSLQAYEDEAQFEEYNYVFMHGEWTVMADYNVPAASLTEGVPVLLRDALAQLDATEKKLRAA